MLMQIDGTFVFVVISFLIFLFIIKTILFNPITKVIEEREKYYEKNSDMEKSSKEKSQKLIDEKEETLKLARKQAGEMIKKVSEEESKKSQEEISKEKEKVNNSLLEHKNSLEKNVTSIKEEIKGEMNEYVSNIISKVLKEDIKIELSEDKIKNHLHI